LTFTYTRLVNTGQPNDKPIILTGPMYLTWAISNTNPGTVNNLLNQKHDNANGAALDFSKNPTGSIHTSSSHTSASHTSASGTSANGTVLSTKFFLIVITIWLSTLH